MQQQACTFISPTGATPLNYLLTLPNAYGFDSTVQWPLLLFLHGRGECGQDLDLLKKYGIPKRLAEVDDFPMIAISPQCPADNDWEAQDSTLIALVDNVIARYAVDDHRLYLTGLSMGGRGAWRLAMLNPNRFAALAPICGRIPNLPGFLDNLSTLRRLPIWVFHGANDQVVPIENSQKIVAALQTLGGNVQFTIYPNADHDSWTATYANPVLYEWLGQHSNANKLS